MSTLSISPIRAYQDNYIWALLNNSSATEASQAWIVDPGDHKPVIEFLEAHQLQLAGILVTHHHWDHTTGLTPLLEWLENTQQDAIKIYGPHNPNIKEISHPLKEGDTVICFDHQVSVMEVPGHTLDHIAYVLKETLSEGEQETLSLFCGDSLFSAGCGRMFEGEYAQMYQSLQKYKALPSDTKVYCTHEYTAANLSFALAVEPANQDIIKEISRVARLDTNLTPSLPSSIGKECSINPYLRTDKIAVQKSAIQASKNNPNQLSDIDYDELRASSDAVDQADIFMAIRQWKDRF